MRLRDFLDPYLLLGFLVGVGLGFGSCAVLFAYLYGGAS